MNDRFFKEPPMVDCSHSPYENIASPDKYSFPKWDATTFAHDRAKNAAPLQENDATLAMELPSESIILQDPGYDADTEVVRPYEIEEPADEPNQFASSESTNPVTPSPVDRWQGDLIDSFQNLQCDPDSNDIYLPLRQNHGQKRKITQYHYISSAESGSGIETEAEETIHSPKRLRRKQSNEKLKAICNASSSRVQTHSSHFSLSSPRVSVSEPIIDLAIDMGLEDRMDFE
jgi:hypothetical protein